MFAVNAGQRSVQLKIGAIAAVFHWIELDFMIIALTHTHQKPKSMMQWLD